ncbi:Lrp/AsnC family transcriptional regulator [Phaeacidiphilus oryzae]|uniref:Lrp/AsnC family transcriptional regulator n=1 Tax=Phaeacidiphilus oryzae TaxID=348818 RepID=UPI00068FE745|nr:Lrp/AsnC family transcriptional regulator [Phaeacidiphilus oryzae]
MAVPTQQSLIGPGSEQPGERLDELDHLLVTALQTAPRADWRSIGAALDVAPTTAARRWARLTSAGLAWMSCYPAQVEGQPLPSAFIEIDCRPGRIGEVAAELAGDCNVLSLEQQTGRRDLLVNAVFLDQAQLGRYLSLRLGRLPGVAGARAELTLVLHTNASRWRLDRLGDRRLAALARRRPRPAPTSEHRPIGSVLQRDLPLVRALGLDPRQPVARLAERTGLSPATVRRRLDALDADEAVIYRCDVARGRSGWPVSVSLWCSAPPARAARDAEALSRFRETRMCAEVTGRSNILLTAWLRSIEELPGFEARIGGSCPELTVDDKAVTVWPMKLGGQLLDPRGRGLGAIPLWAWSEGEPYQAADAAERELVGRLRAAAVIPSGPAGPWG